MAFGAATRNSMTGMTSDLLLATVHQVVAMQ
jgi:hypothetical protein